MQQETGLLALPDHPKKALYLEAYDPLVSEWFASLFSGPGLHRTLISSQRGALGDNFRRLNALFEETADLVIERADPMCLGVIRQHQSSVLWNGLMMPPPQAGLAEIAASFRYKIKRNIGQALLEGLLCLMSAWRFLSGINVDALRSCRVLINSTSLVATLSALHDERQIACLVQLLDGRPFWYPEVSFEQIASNEFNIASIHFKLTGTGSTEQVRLVNLPQTAPPTEGPTMSCPAHRLRGPEAQRLNDSFWHILMETFVRSTEPDAIKDDRLTLYQTLEKQAWLRSA